MRTNQLPGQFIDFYIKRADLDPDSLSRVLIRHGIATAFYPYKCAFIGFVRLCQSAIKGLLGQCNSGFPLILKQFYFRNVPQIMILPRIIHTSGE